MIIGPHEGNNVDYSQVDLSGFFLTEFHDLQVSKDGQTAREVLLTVSRHTVDGRWVHVKVSVPGEFLDKYPIDLEKSLGQQCVVVLAVPASQALPM